MTMDKNEITSLNFADLDVEELEHRLELAVAGAQPLGVWCNCNGRCGIDFPKPKK
jgi:hypothetical protein